MGTVSALTHIARLRGGVRVSETLTASTLLRTRITKKAIVMASASVSRHANSRPAPPGWSSAQPVQPKQEPVSRGATPTRPPLS